MLKLTLKQQTLQLSMAIRGWHR